MLYGINSGPENSDNKFHQRVADQNIQIDQRQEEIQHAKNGFIGMLAGIVVGGIVGWVFLSPAENLNKEKVIPIVRRPINPAKVQPNDPGGMEIDNQNREIYHIVDNTPKSEGKVNIIPTPEMPQLVVERDIETPENIENLVESIENDISLKEVETPLEKPLQDIKIANSALSAINTNSKEKIVIPQKIKDIEVKVQKNVNTETSKETVQKIEASAEKKENTPVINKTVKSTKGTWYTQIIASSSRKSVENLWKNLIAKHTFLKEYPYEIERITAANGNNLYRLKVGMFKTRAEAEKLSNKLKQNKVSSIIKQN